jgi:PEGA domain
MATTLPQPGDDREGARGVVVPLRPADEADPNWDPSAQFSPEDTESTEKPGNADKQENTEKPSAPETPRLETLATAAPLPDAPPPRRKTTRIVWIGLALLVVAAGVTWAVLVVRGRAGDGAQLPLVSTPPAGSVAAPATGSVEGTGAPPTMAREGAVTINSSPPGAQVVIDEIPRGTTPLTLAVAAGDHVLLLRHGAVTRALPLVVKAGTESTHYIDLPISGTATGDLPGRLDITSDPPGASVSVDGVKRGVTPLVLPSVAPGVRTVVISDGASSVTRTVRVSPGATAAVVASLTPAGASAGWLALQSPLELQILDGGRIIGTTATARIMLPVGRHDLELVSEPFQFRAPLAVQITAGTVSAPTVALPNGSLFINATPWAAGQWVRRRSRASPCPSDVTRSPRAIRNWASGKRQSS